jgi:hypothetical protein
MASREEITTFSYEIERIAKDNSISYMDAVIFYCEKNSVEIELAAKLVSSALKSKIKVEAESLNFLPKSNTGKLPL